MKVLRRCHQEVSGGGAEGFLRAEDDDGVVDGRREVDEADESDGVERRLGRLFESVVDACRLDLVLFGENTWRQKL